MPIDSFTLTQHAPRPQRYPQQGDLKITKKGLFRRMRSMTKEGYLVHSDGRQRHHWVRIGDTPADHDGQWRVLWSYIQADRPRILELDPEFNRDF